MKKYLIKCNSFLYAVLYTLSLLYAGFVIGKTYQNFYGPILRYLNYPVGYLILFLFSVHLVREHEYATGKGYWVMALVTLGCIPILWVNRLGIYLQEQSTATPVFDYVVFPTVLLIFSVIISTNYIISAVKAHKENKQYKY